MPNEDIILSISELRVGGGSETQIPLHLDALLAAGLKASAVTRKDYTNGAVGLTLKSNLATVFARGYFCSYLSKDHLIGAFRRALGIGRWLPYEQTHPDYYGQYANKTLVQKLKHWIQINLYLCFADALIVQTESARLAWSKKLPSFPIEKIFTLPNIVPKGPDHQNLADGPFKIVMVGRLIAVKNYDFAIRVFALLNKSAN